jgi:hypothetical protein
VHLGADGRNRDAEVVDLVTSIVSPVPRTFTYRHFVIHFVVSLPCSLSNRSHVGSGHRSDCTRDRPPPFAAAVVRPRSHGETLFEKLFALSQQPLRG